VVRARLHSLAAGALALTLSLAWLNLLLTGRWAAIDGALHGWRLPWYTAALALTSVLLAMTRRRVGDDARLGHHAALGFALLGSAWLLLVLMSMLPPARWNHIPFRDDWTVFFQQSVNGVHLLRHGAISGWNWWMLGGYPTSTDIAQNFGLIAFLPMTILGDRIGYHVLHVVVFLALPAMVWWDVRQEDRIAGLVAAGLTAVFVAGYSVTLGKSGDTNSLMGVFSATMALAGSRGARLGRRWGGAVLLLGLTLALYSHQAFFVYAVLFLFLEAAYCRDPRALLRLVLAAAIALIAALPMYWESLRHHDYVSFNNMVFNPDAPTDWRAFPRLVFYNVQILALPGRWFNDCRSLANVWLPVLAFVAVAARRSRAGFYAAAAVLTQAILRFNTPIAGAGFDRIQHMLPVLEGPALAGFVMLFGGSRRLALAMLAAIALFIATSREPVRHVQELRAFDPPLIDRIAAADGMVLVEHSPHRDMDADPIRRTPTTPFDAHFEGLLPGVAGQRFYSQMIDGWVWNVWRGQVVAAGTFRAQPISFTTPEAFAGEMRRWGVAHLFVWSDASRDYLAGSDEFTAAWRGGLWSEFDLVHPDLRTVVMPTGTGALRNLTFLGGAIALTNARAGDEVVVRAHYYPAWRADVDGTDVPLHAADGQLAFRAPRDGSYTVVLEYPRYRWLSLIAIGAFVAGVLILRR
jgi:hypothetical protein